MTADVGGAVADAVRRRSRRATTRRARRTRAAGPATGWPAPPDRSRRRSSRGRRGGRGRSSSSASTWSTLVSPPPATSRSMATSQPSLSRSEITTVTPARPAPGEHVTRRADEVGRPGGVERREHLEQRPGGVTPGEPPRRRGRRLGVHDHGVAPQQRDEPDRRRHAHGLVELAVHPHRRRAVDARCAP